MTRVLATLLSTLAFSSLLPAQQATLTRYEFEYPGVFTEVSAVRELSNGSVIVLDMRERRISSVAKDGRSTVIGRTGQGPGEYVLPLTLFALPADSTLAYDMLGGRMHVITSQGTIAGALPEADMRGVALNIGLGSATDARGRIYIENRAAGDSIAIERVERSAGARTIVARVNPYVLSPLLPVRRGGGSGGREGGPSAGEPPPFWSRDRWAVAPDGRIAVVTVNPYSVAFTQPDGSKRSYAIPGGAALRVSEAHKAAWRENRKRPVATLNYGRNQVTASFAPPNYVEPTAWPDQMPAFLADAQVRFASDGVLWVQRSTAADAPPQYDLIDPAGKVLGRLTAPPRTRLVGFGVNTVYMVRLDDDDLEHLQRYRLPGR